MKKIRYPSFIGFENFCYYDVFLDYDVFVTDRSTAADTKISTVSDAFFAAIEGNTLIQSTLSNVFLLNRFKSLESLKIGKFSNEIVTNASLETIESFDWNRKLRTKIILLQSGFYIKFY